MVKTLDTNIYVYSTLSEMCSKEVNNTIGNKYGYIILYTVFQETEEKIEYLNTILSVLSHESPGKDILKLLKSKRYIQFKKKFPQIYNTLWGYLSQGYFDKDSRFDQFAAFIENLKIHIAKILGIIRMEKLRYPPFQEEYEKIEKSDLFQKTLITLSFIDNDKDISHLALIKNHITQTKKDVNFYTLDNKDFHKNKKKIERLINRLSIKNLTGFDKNNFTIVSP